MIISISSGFPARSALSSSTVIMPLSISPSTSSRMSREHSPVFRIFLAKFRPFLMFRLSSALHSSVSCEKSSSDFSKRNILISGSSRFKNSDSVSPRPFKNCIMTTYSPSQAFWIARPKAAGDFPWPSPLKI